MVATIILIRERTRSKRISLELSLLESEQKAVTAQINPHFIYNAMNSVQYHVLQDDSIKASDQLAKFSELMRRVLSNTKDTFIPLVEEIKIIELYLSLEKERFESKLQYELIIEQELKQEHILIPSMVVQPHIENAIWHGVLNKKNGQGKLSVAISNSGENIVWKIKDNGVGRKATQKLKDANRDGYTSSGVGLTQKRLELLSRNLKKTYKITIHDLENSKGEAEGTEVVIVMYKKSK